MVHCKSCWYMCVYYFSIMLNHDFDQYHVRSPKISDPPRFWSPWFLNFFRPQNFSNKLGGWLHQFCSKTWGWAGKGGGTGWRGKVGYEGREAVGGPEAESVKGCCTEAIFGLKLSVNQNKSQGIQKVDASGISNSIVIVRLFTHLFGIYYELNYNLEN